MSSVVERKWAYDEEFVHRERQAKMEKKNAERKQRYQDDFLFKMCVNVGGKVINDMKELVELYGKDVEKNDDAIVIILFPDGDSWSYDEFMIGMREYGVDCVDWGCVMKVMVKRVLCMLDEGGEYYDGVTWDINVLKEHINGYHFYPSYAECKSFEWFVGEYFQYIYAFKYEALKTEMDKKGITKEIIEKIKELKEWAFMNGVKINGEWW